MRVDTQVDSASNQDDDKQHQAASNAPVPISIQSEGVASQEAQGGPGQEAGRFFRIHLKSPTGWQLDGRVTHHD